MAVFPGPQDLGPVNPGSGERPIGQASAEGFTRGVQQLGQGVEQLGQGVEGYNDARARYQYRITNAELGSQLLTLEDAQKHDTNFGPDASGQNMPQRFSTQAQQIRDSLAAKIDNPGMRDLFVQTANEHIQRGTSAANDRAYTLQGQHDVAQLDQTHYDFASRAVQAGDHTQLATAFRNYADGVDSLVQQGHLTAEEGLLKKQRFASDAAVAENRHMAMTNPQGALNIVQAAPGSDDEMTERVLHIEGTGKPPTSLSHAEGYGQFEPKTWLPLIKQLHPELANRSDNDLLALRADPNLGREMTKALLQQNRGALQSQGLEPSAGNLYLAHFLGSGGAAQLLKADPNTPVAELLPSKVIDANGSVLRGKTAGSVIGWAANKMGGIAPGQGSLMSFVMPQQRAQLEVEDTAAVQKQNVEDTAAFGLRVANAESEAINTGAVTQPISKEEFIARYGADRGPIEYQTYDTQVQTGHTIATMATMTSDQREATINSLQPQPGDPNFALKQKAFEVATQARQNIEQEAVKDPAGFAASRLPASKDAYEALRSVLGASDATPEDRANVAQAYAAKTLMEQSHFGLPPGQQEVAPKSYVDALQKEITTAATNDDPQARVKLIGRIQSEAAMWGGYWPQVMRQLAPTSQPIVRAIAAGADPNAITRLLSLPADEAKQPSAILRQVNGAKAKELDDGLNTAFAPFRSSLVGRQLDRDFPGYLKLGTELGALYMRDGDDAKTAANKAFTALIGGRYDFPDTYRIPKSAGVNPDDVQAGAQDVRSRLSAFPIKPAIDDMGLGSANAGGSEDSGLSPQQVLQRNAPYLKSGAGDYYTKLAPQDETQFRDWVAKNKVAFNPDDKLPDYDMRGFWKGLQSGDARAKNAVDPNDGKMHYPDYWKTPYDLTFSSQSQWANSRAPSWNDKDQLVTPEGKVVFDDRAPRNHADDANTADSFSKFARDGKWVTAADNSGLNLAYDGKFVRSTSPTFSGPGGAFQISWAQLANLGSHVRSGPAPQDTVTKRENAARHGVEAQ